MEHREPGRRRPLTARPAAGPGRRRRRADIRVLGGGVFHVSGEPPRAPLWRQVVGAALRRARLRHGWTLRHLAEAARVSLPYLSEIERGRKEVSSEILAAICRALGLRLSDLLDEVMQELARTDPGRLPAAPPPRQPVAAAGRR